MTDPTSPSTRPAWRRWARRLAQAAAGLALGLALAEVAFHLRDHGAFPHLNVYVPDARLGVRLRPGATQRVAFGKNPVTSVRINGDGFRGADLPPPSEGEILVVGDSQVFGLGVEEHETASAELSRILGGRAVVNAGVPTYGPPEYNAVAGELLARRRARTVIYVVNLVNDLFEASHPNRDRHRVWDGWAVRQETAPASITSFPGREILFRQSHLVLAMRSYLHARGPEVDDQGFASEGTVRDLVGASAQAGDDHARADRETEARKAERDAKIEDTRKRELTADLAIEDLALSTFALRGTERGRAYQLARDNPGDIVLHVTPGIPGRHHVEDARGSLSTVEILVQGAQVRREMEAKIRAFTELVTELEANGVVSVHALPAAAAERWRLDPLDVHYEAEEVAREMRQGDGHDIGATGRALVRTFEAREALAKRLDELRKAPAEAVRAWSPMTPILRELKAACDARRARLLVVALPMDVQVSPSEWAKYGVATPVDVAPTKILVDDLVASAEGIGAAALDATPALAAAEPGAFLDGDIHLTPKGHRALAEAIAAKLATVE
jgi:hypothetical protein